MRPLYLVISAFGSYAGKAEIDFEKLDRSGLYLITGDTGAGKTTIFDAIMFGLYGRASGSVRDNTKGFRSIYAPLNVDTYVEFTFENKGEKYKVKRNPEYTRLKKKGGENETTTEKPSASLHLLSEDDEELIESKTERVADKITEILGVDAEQFSRMAMLAQGEFKEFLLADAKKKQEMFTELFHTEIFKKIQERVKYDFSQAKNEMDSVKDDIFNEISKIDVEGDYNNSLKADIERQYNNDSPDIENAYHLINRQEIEDRKLQEELSNKRASKLKEKEELNSKKEKEKERQQKNLSLEKAKSDRAAAINDRERLAGELDEAKKNEPVIETNKGLIATIESKLGNYEKLDNHKSDIDKYSQESENKKVDIENNNEKAKNLEDELAADKTQAEKLVGEKDKLNEIEKALDEAKAKKTALKTILDKCREYGTEQNAYKTIQAEFEKAQKGSEEANRAYENLNNLFLAEQAGFLAVKMMENKTSCPVCGCEHHLIHPDKVATLSQDAPTEKEVEQAKIHADKKAKEFTDISVEAGNIKTRIKDIDKDIADRAKELSLILAYNGETELNITDIESKAKAEFDECSEKYTKLLKDRDDSEKEVNRITKIIDAVKGKEDSVNSLKDTIEKLKAELGKAESSLAAANASYEAIKSGLEYESKTVAETKINDLKAENHKLQKAIDDKNNELTDTNNKISSYEGSIATLEADLKNYAIADIDELNDKYDKVEEEISRIDADIEAITGRISVNSSVRTSIQKLEKNLKENEDNYLWQKPLYDTVVGRTSGKEKIDLETYVVEDYFERILLRANDRFNIMSDGKFELKRSEQVIDGRKKFGLDVEIVDHYSGGVRSAKTLSGGECFMASLSLALGLADEVAVNSGGIKLDSLFVDEGFGSLDDESLDTAIGVLSRLSEGNRQIGIISHIHKLVNVVDHMIYVEKDANGVSKAEVI